MRKILLLLIFSLIAATAGAQSATVSGVVKDESGGIVSGATVIVRSAAGVERQTVTGPDGRFSLDVNSPADAALVVRAGGFAEWQRALAGQREVDVVLKAPRLLESVTVTPSRTAQCGTCGTTLTGVRPANSARYDSTVGQFTSISP